MQVLLSSAGYVKKYGRHQAESRLSGDAIGLLGL